MASKKLFCQNFPTFVSKGKFWIVKRILYDMRNSFGCFYTFTWGEGGVSVQLGCQGGVVFMSLHSFFVTNNVEPQNL